MQDNLLLCSKELLMQHLWAFVLDPRLLEVILYNPSKHYRIKLLPKKGFDASRVLHIPRDDLKKVQRVLRQDVLSSLKIHESVHGFVKGKSWFTHADSHSGLCYVITVDITDFFGSIDRMMLRNCLLSNDADKDVVNTLLRLCTYKDKETLRIFLPQGAPTSPILSNAVMFAVDTRLCDFAKQHDWTYTRYADDIALSCKTLSACKHADKVQKVLETTMVEAGFRLHKLYSGPSNKDVEITGLVVNETGTHARQVWKDRLEYARRVTPENTTYIQGLQSTIDYVEGTDG